MILYIKSKWCSEHTLSRWYKQIYKQEVRCEKASLLINKYLKKYDISQIEYIKIDIEGADDLVLNDLLKNNILCENLSVECHKSEVLELLLNSKFKSFKFVEGGDVTFKTKYRIINQLNEKKIINFWYSFFRSIWWWYSRRLLL